MKLPYQFGRYTLVEKIANGGMSEVFRAVFRADAGFEKTVAIKRLLPAWGGDDSFREMLIDEARALVNLQHQSIVQVFELEQYEGIPFLAMEFIHGIDCSRLITKTIQDRAEIPVMHALYIINQVLFGLEFAHRSTDPHGEPINLVHRDISPSNILISWNGEVKVTDFGIAKGHHRTNGTVVGQLKGKYSYMSPEQAASGEIDARSDLFSCGSVLFELLTGKKLFSGATDIEILDKVRNPKLPFESLGSLAPELKTILILALASNPDMRYQSAAQMLSDVQNYARKEGMASSSLELASYLRDKFGSEQRTTNLNAAAIAQSEPGTKIMDAVQFIIPEGLSRGYPSSVIPECLSRGSRLIRIRRILGTAAAIGIVMCVPSSDTAGRSPAPEQAKAPLADTVANEESMTSGSIAVDSTPSGAKGTLTIGEKQTDITTPFSLNNIKIDNSADATLKLNMPGYKEVSHSFKLSSASPVLVKSFDLKKTSFATVSVQARPWGLVDIPGHISGRETPVGGVRLAAGSYQVKVRFPPTGQVAAANIEIADGASKRCTATFDGKPAISCR